MEEANDLATGYYRVRKGAHPSGAPHWSVARWMPTEGKTVKTTNGQKAMPAWRTGDGVFDPGHWDEIGPKVA